MFEQNNFLYYLRCVYYMYFTQVYFSEFQIIANFQSSLQGTDMETACLYQEAALPVYTRRQPYLFIPGGSLTCLYLEATKGVGR